MRRELPHNNMKIKTLYEKKVYPSGKARYIPTGTQWPSNYFTEGVYLVRVKPGDESVVSIISPDRAEVLAAIEEAREAMQEKLAELLRFLPQDKLTSDIEQEAYRNYAETLTDKGLDPYPMQLSMKSVWGIVDAAIVELKHHIAEFR